MYQIVRYHSSHMLWSWNQFVVIIQKGFKSKVLNLRNQFVVIIQKGFKSKVINGYCIVTFLRLLSLILSFYSPEG